MDVRESVVRELNSIVLVAFDNMFDSLGFFR